jgi:hypothetical protein
MTKLNKVSPYKFISDLKDELEDDLILKHIIILCNLYLTSNHISDEDEIKFAIDFLKTKINELDDLKSSFEIQTNIGPFARIGHALDSITVIDDLKSFNAKSLYMDLSYNIDTLIGDLITYLNILNKIMIEFYKGKK